MFCIKFAAQTLAGSQEESHSVDASDARPFTRRTRLSNKLNDRLFALSYSSIAFSFAENQNIFTFII